MKSEKMQTKYKYIAAAVIFQIFAVFAYAQDNEVISSVKQEIDRSMEKLKIDKLKPPFYIGYDLIDAKFLYVTASLGSVVNTETYSMRRGVPTLLVGDYHRNNTGFGRNAFAQNVSLDNEGLSTSIWEALDRAYKNSAEDYEVKLATIAQQKLDQEELDLDDFEKITPTSLSLNPAKINLDKAYWENYAKKVSEIFRKYPEIIESSVNIFIRDAMHYSCNSENKRIAMPVPFYQIRLGLFTIADDGQELRRELYIEHPSFEQMPKLQTFIDSCEAITKKFIEHSKAPMIKEAYSGPVLFEGQAVPEIFQQMIVGNLLAARKPVRGNSFGGGGGNNLEMMTGKKLISRSLTVTSLSGSETYKGKKLDAWYPVDAEGVIPDKELVMIEKGVLKNMLNGRAPTNKYPHSNGHKRMSVNDVRPNVMPGNVLLSSTNSFTDLKKKLIEAAKEEDLDYAYIIRGYRGIPFEVYRVYVSDGREEPVRGAVMQDFNLKSFKRVLGTSDREMIYNTASFGNFVTYIVPDGILFEELEITKNNGITLKTPFIVPQPK
ncbi:MAG: hypothetical protein LBC98_02420 [Prevotellaceae bacterium]|jgi:predicted Zn-dependent protease|nr:hypothetical protein [Prevotellaceae bacterium]